MTQRNDGGSAFPHNEKNDDGSHHLTNPGMSLRDWFAGQALAGLLSNRHIVIAETEIVPLPETAYFYADAMLAARNKPEGEEK